MNLKIENGILIDEMQAGPELNALVAEWVMGLSQCKCEYRSGVASDGLTCECLDCDPDVAIDYSTDIAAAWQVMKKMLDAHGDMAYVFALELCGGPLHFFSWTDEDVIFYVLIMLNRLSPLVICRAALKAIKI